MDICRARDALTATGVAARKARKETSTLFQWSRPPRLRGCGWSRFESVSNRGQEAFCSTSWYVEAHSFSPSENRFPESCPPWLGTSRIPTRQRSVRLQYIVFQGVREMLQLRQDTVPFFTICLQSCHLHSKPPRVSMNPSCGGQAGFSFRFCTLSGLGAIGLAPVRLLEPRTVEVRAPAPAARLCRARRTLHSS